MLAEVVRGMKNKQTGSDELAARLDEIIRLCRAAMAPIIRARLLKSLDSPEKLIAFRLSDDRGTDEVSTTAKIGTKTLQELWKEWHGNGWGYMKNVKGGKRFVRTISLEEFGIDDA